MRKTLLAIVLFIFLVLEGVALELLPESFINVSIIFIPHWILVFLIVLNLFYETNKPHIFIVYAIIFGLLVDIVYTDTLGVYMFAYGLALFVATLLKRILQENFLMTIITTIIAIMIIEGVIGGVYTVLGITNVYWLDNLTMRLIPTIIANLVFLFIIYPFAKKVIINLNNRIPD